MSATKIFTVLTFSLTVAIAAAQEVEVNQPYTIEKQEEEVSQGSTMFTETYRRDGKWDLTRIIAVTDNGKEVFKSWGFSKLKIWKSLARNADETDKTKILFDRGLSVFGWYGKENKSMFDTVYSAAAVLALDAREHVHEVDNLLLRTDAGDYELLDQSGLDMVKAKGVVATIENRIGQQLARKKGILVTQKHYQRGDARSGDHFSCHEALVKLGPDEHEKRYTFFGDQLGVKYKILEWTVNSKSKFSWIDCETGFGSFMFQDGDGDGVFETLELVIDNDRNVEIFDVSDPWNISLVPLDSELFKDAKDLKNLADELGKRISEDIAEGLMVRPSDRGEMAD